MSTPVGPSVPVRVSRSAPGVDARSGVPDAGSRVPMHEREIPESLRAEIEKANALLAGQGVRLAFSIDSATKKTIITVVNGQTNEVVRQIPPEEVLRVSRQISKLTGVLFDDAA